MEEPSLISMHPFVKVFVENLIATVKVRNLRLNRKGVIHADMVPRVSDQVMKASMAEKTVSYGAHNSGTRKEVAKRDMSALIAPIEKPILTKPKISGTKPPVMRNPMTPKVAQIQRPFPQSLPRQSFTAPPVIPVSGAIDPQNEFGKMSPLLNDASVSSIECPGEGKELVIMRMGQKQKTRISLNAGEIKKILEISADKAHIPLIEGVFRATLPGFSINAVISEMIGSRFVVKKTTGYGILG